MEKLFKVGLFLQVDLWEKKSQKGTQGETNLGHATLPGLILKIIPNWQLQIYKILQLLLFVSKHSDLKVLPD